MTLRKKNPMSRKDSGALGGQRTKFLHGSEHFSYIGALGAAANIERNGPDQPFRALAIARGHDISAVAPSRKGDAK